MPPRGTCEKASVSNEREAFSFMPYSLRRYSFTFMNFFAHST